MSEKLREKLNYLHNELDGLREIQRSISPSKLMAKSLRRSSRSPRPSTVNQHQQTISTVAHDSRPDIAAWPAPPPISNLGKIPHHQKIPSTTSTGTSPIPESHFQASTSFGEDSNRLLSMLMSASANPNAIRGREFELRRKIQNLEETVAEYERQKFNVLGTFSEYRDYVAERERTLEAEYSGKIIQLSEEVLGAKKDFEARMNNFTALQDQFNRDKEQALENLRQEHQKEIEMLERRVAGSQLLNLEQKYIIEIRRLEDERKSLKTEKERLVETFDMKLRRAQSLYETQLTTAKALYSKELETLRSHEENLKEELEARHEEFRDRVQELKLQSRQSREEMSTCKTEITILQKKLKQKESELEGITKELENVRAELMISMRKLREVDIRYAKTFDELSKKETELNNKAKLLDQAEDSRTSLESTIRKLQVEVKGLKNKVDFLEIERENLECQRDSQTHLQTSQINTLEAVLESVTKEKETSKEHYEKLLEQADAREKSLRKELSSKFSELEEQYNALKDYVDDSGLGPESAKILEEVGVLRAQKNYLEEEISNLHAQLAEDKQKVNEENSLDYIADMSRAVESMRKNVQNNLAQTSKSSDNRDVGVNTQDNSEIHILLSKLVQVEKDVQTIIIEKNEAKSKLIRLEEENRNLAKRLNEAQANEQKGELSKMKDRYEKVMEQLENERNLYNQLQEKMNRKEVDGQDANELTNKLTKVKEEAKNKDKQVNELNENLKMADRKNKILLELIEYQQKGPIDEAVEDLLTEVGTKTDDMSQEELHQVFGKYEKLKKPEKKPVETRHIETSTKPEVREMSLQTNIEIKQAPSQSEELQKEIVSMLANLMNGKSDEYSDLLELKKVLMSTAESASSSDEMPESPRVPPSCQRGESRLQHLVSQIERREKKFKVGPSNEYGRKDDQMEVSRSRSPSLMSRHRERTPSKTASTSMESSRNFAYSSDLSLESKRKRASKLDRPAWKF